MWIRKYISVTFASCFLCCMIDWCESNWRLIDIKSVVHFIGEIGILKIPSFRMLGRMVTFWRLSTHMTRKRRNFSTVKPNWFCFYGNRASNARNQWWTFSANIIRSRKWVTLHIWCVCWNLFQVFANDLFGISNATKIEKQPKACVVTRNTKSFIRFHLYWFFFTH